MVRLGLHGIARRAPSNASLGSMNRSHGCVLLPTHSAHYGEAYANLLSMLRFATDAALPPVHVVVDRESDRKRMGGVFPAACASSHPPAACNRLATFVRVISLEGLLDAQGEGIETQRHIHDTVAAEFAAWSAACRRTRSAASCSDPSWQLGPSVRSNLCSYHASLSPPPPLATCHARPHAQARSVCASSTDFFRPVTRAAWLGHGGHPKRPVPSCPAADYLSWKRKYQAIKKLYAAESMAQQGCELIWVMDSESFALSRFSFAQIFGDYIQQPRLHVSGGPAPPCATHALLHLWGLHSMPRRAHGAQTRFEARLDCWHDDFWIWEGRHIRTMMAQMRRAHAPRALVDLLLTAEGGTLSEQVLYGNWLLWRASTGHQPIAQLVDVPAALRHSQPDLFAGAPPQKHQVGQAAAKLVEMARAARRSLSLSQAKWTTMRTTLLHTLRDSGWHHVRGWGPSPWGVVDEMLPEWHPLWCLSNCAPPPERTRCRLLEAAGDLPFAIGLQDWSDYYPSTGQWRPWNASRCRVRRPREPHQLGKK